MAKVLDCKIVLCEFEPQLQYYIHFRANTFVNDTNPLIPQTMD